jgi:hypothetical protein
VYPADVGPEERFAFRLVSPCPTATRQLLRRIGVYSSALRAISYEILDSPPGFNANHQPAGAYFAIGGQWRWHQNGQSVAGRPNDQGEFHHE